MRARAPAWRDIFFRVTSHRRYSACVCIRKYVDTLKLTPQLGYLNVRTLPRVPNVANHVWVCVRLCTRGACQLSAMFDQNTIYVYMRANTTYARVSSYKVRRSQNCSEHLQRAQFMIDSRSAGAFIGTNLLREVTKVKTNKLKNRPSAERKRLLEDKTLSSAKYNTPASRKVARVHTMYVITKCEQRREWPKASMRGMDTPAKGRNLIMITNKPNTSTLEQHLQYSRMHTYTYFIVHQQKDTSISGHFGSKINRSVRTTYKPKTRSALNESAFHANNLVNNAESYAPKGSWTTASTNNARQQKHLYSNTSSKLHMSAIIIVLTHTKRTNCSNCVFSFWCVVLHLSRQSICRVLVLA